MKHYTEWTLVNILDTEIDNCPRD